LIWSNSQRYGGYIVHAGIVLMAIGIIGSSFYSADKEDTLKVGDSINIKQYTVTYTGLEFQKTPDKDIYIADLLVYKSGILIDKVISEKYVKQGQTVTEVGIRSNLVEDLYIILQGWSESGSTADFKIMVNPLVSWIWIGGGIFLLGGLITFWPVRRKKFEVLEDQISNGNEEEQKPLLFEPLETISSPQKTKNLEDEIEHRIQKMRQIKGNRCPNCGSLNQLDARFCRQCAAKLSRGKKGD
jgi:hypothetical protein